ncbi:MAG TPA: LPS export ABC transporter permease LptF [Terriglobales bacterium]|nr:LPS export ABC transporter permease LptF [Terriglobales bacterium]
MRIFTRYILREVLSHALIGAAVFTFVIFLRDLEKILELVVRASAPLPSVAELFFFTVPTALTITIPMGVLVGILIGLSRLAADSEVTAMRASGIGVATFVRIISIFVLAAWMLAMVNNVYWAPRSAAALDRLQDKLKTSQVSFEIQPRVFYEGFRNIVLYVQDATTTAGSALWRNVFLADITDPSNPKIIVARQGMAVSEGPQNVHLHLMYGQQHETDPKNPQNYSITTFNVTDIPIQMPPENQGQPTPATELTTSALLREAGLIKNRGMARSYMIEFNRRLALPTACLVLALVGIPLGLSSKKGGKSTGIVLTIALVFVYYFISLFGVSLARQGKLSPALGVWLANILFFIGGVALLWRVDQMPIEIGSVRAWWERLRQRVIKRKQSLLPTRTGSSALERVYSRKRVFSARFPLLLDDYILREFVTYLVMILTTFLILVLVFTFFELLSDILRNKIPLTIVGEYLLNVAPYLIYKTTPMSMLLAVLVTLGLMQKANELTAMKASGISIYRIVVPILLTGVLLAGALFFFDQFYLPAANRRQDALRNIIKGKPAQTYLRPDRRWIVGQHDTIYYYQFFDSDRDQFARITAYEFEPRSFQITRRIYAARAHWEDSLGRWIYEKGWDRAFHGPAIGSYKKFDVSTFAELSEPPAYFKKEVKQSSEMSYEELTRYIRDLEQSGFDVVRLKVQLQEKFAFPLITFVMAILAIPFALTTARRGALTGVAVAVGIAVAYTIVSSLFEAMGNLSQLPPLLAAWSPDLIFALVGGYMVLKVPT